MATCQRCAAGNARAYHLGLFHDDGREEGEFVAGLDLTLCDHCRERLAIMINAGDFGITCRRERIAIAAAGGQTSGREG